MADLAFIHPLLVRNPLPPDRLDAGLKQASAASALVTTALGQILRQPGLDAYFPVLAEHETLMRRSARHWHDALLPSYTACMDGVGSFASHLNQALTALHHAAADMEVDPGARRRLQDGFALQRQSARVQLANARRVATVVDHFRCTFASDFVSFIVDVDAVNSMLANDPPARLQFRQLVDERQRLIGDAMAAVTNVITALAAIESAWHTLATHIESLETQLNNGELGGALLEARLKSARQEWGALAAIDRRPPALRGQAGAAPVAAPALRAVSAFGHHDIGEGAVTIATNLGLIDSLAQGIANFPSRESGGVPAVVRHIGAVKRLAHGWPLRGRPALMGALEGLKNFGDAFIETDALRLQSAFERMAAGDDKARLLAAELVGGLVERLGSQVSAFEAVTADIQEYLVQMAGISDKLNADTSGVTERLRAEHERALSLAGKAAELQVQVEASAGRRRWRWLLGALATQPLDVLEANLRGVTTQLEELRLDQAATMDDAAYLQSLLPALSTYLSGIDQVAAGIRAALGGTQSLQFQLAELKHAIGAPGTALTANRQLLAALADWREVCASIGQLAPA